MANHQRIRRTALVVLALGCAAAFQAHAETYLGFSVGVGHAPPPPRIIVADAPQLVAVPGTSVYALANTNYDVFTYRGSYFLYNGGFWYRAPDYAGPYVAVDVRSVPRPILVVPADRWKHHPHGGPPGQTKKGHGRS